MTAAIASRSDNKISTETRTESRAPAKQAVEHPQPIFNPRRDLTIAVPYAFLPGTLVAEAERLLAHIKHNFEELLAANSAADRIYHEALVRSRLNDGAAPIEVDIDDLCRGLA
jgi:hypothetical protein